MKLKQYILIGLVGLSVAGGVAFAADLVQNFYGDTTVTLSGQTEEQTMGGFYSPGIIGLTETMETYAPTATTTTKKLKSKNSGTTYLLSATGTTITLPAKEKGLNFKFVVNGAVDTANIVIDSAEGDNIEGTLMVAGAVVDCDAEDQINIVADGENIGDYVELYCDGTQWLIRDSGVSSSTKMTCTDPS